MSSGTTRCTVMLAPSYYESFSTADWDALITAGRTSAPYAVFNPHSGPGNAFDPPWSDIRGRLLTGGMKAPAYIDTYDATRPLAEVYGEIDTYEAWYQPDGLFLDNAGQAAGNTPYLRSIRDYMRSKMARPTILVLNVGVYSDQSYMAVGDILNLEGTYADWSTRGAEPAWTQQYSKSRFSLMLTDTTADQMAAMVTSAATHGIGYAYATDATGANWGSYNHVPGYWSQEISNLHSTCL